MALPMLVSGAECGPINPLQGLTKRFDHDRGIQQDQFGAGRAGPSRQTFRAFPSSNPLLEQEAARFFGSGSNAQANQSNASINNPFDLSLLRGSLPHSDLTSPLHTPSPFAQDRLQSQTPNAASSWAADFMKLQTASPVQDSQASMGKGKVAEPGSASGPVMRSPVPQMVGTQWRPMADARWGAGALQHSASLPTTTNNSMFWDKEFQSHEESLRTVSQSQADIASIGQQASKSLISEQDDLAKVAGMLVDTVKDEQNPKFKNSQFLNFMRRVRDGEVVVDGNDMVERSESQLTAVDVKGKGKERASTPPPVMVMDPSTSSTFVSQVSPQRRKSVHFDQRQRAQTESEQDAQATHGEENENDAYFREENESYINYWNQRESELLTDAHTAQRTMDQENEWGYMQDSWDAYEATTYGVKPISGYEFQPRNPYLHDGAMATMTRNHAVHSRHDFHESVLELEAAVQRDPTNARAWFDLGVKQQENEREQKAILALKRALELDPLHLPALLAMAISHTNENDRMAADVAIERWVRQNKDYADVVSNFFRVSDALNTDTDHSVEQMRHHSTLIDCLMMMAREGAQRGELDADVQIALAVLLNTSEDYGKAQDCFKAALAVRPEDWQLYNRVGATLANSGNAEEALQYYSHALELNPVYIRARFNLGISCINLKRHEEAAHHILDALVLQDSDGSVHAQNEQRGITSSALWDSLKTTCLHLQRTDLANLCDKKDLDGFRRDFHL